MVVAGLGALPELAAWPRSCTASSNSPDSGSAGCEAGSQRKQPHSCAPSLRVPPGSCKLVAIEWFSGAGGPPAPGAPTLALALDNGRLQLMRSEADDAGVCVDTGLRVRHVKWSHDGAVGGLGVGAAAGAAGWRKQWCVPLKAGRPGEVRERATRAGLRPSHATPHLQMLAVAGAQPAMAGSGTGAEPWLVQFYSAAGEHLRTLRVPGGASGGGVAGVAWDRSGQRLALAADAALLLASVRRQHLWGWLAGGTVAYAVPRADRPNESCVVFWDTRSNTRCGGASGWRAVGVAGCPCLRTGCPPHPQH